jgi:RimJ/RimL family protein N-acetyltransferase
LSDHNLTSVKSFVNEKLVSDNDYLFGIFWDECHIGNIKLGPINWHHMTGDVSYFLGSKDHWGKGIATLAVGTVVVFADKVLHLKKTECRLLRLKYRVSQSVGKMWFQASRDKGVKRPL